MIRGILRDRKTYLRIGFCIALVVFLLSKINYRHIVILHLNWWVLPFLFGLPLCSYLIRSLFYQRTVNVVNLKICDFFLVTGVYNFLSSVFPFGAGHLSYPYFLKKYYGTPVYRGLSSLILYNAIRVLILFSIFVCSGFFLNVFEGVFLRFHHKLLFALGLLPVAFFLAMKVLRSNNNMKVIKEFIAKVVGALKENVGVFKTGTLMAYSLLVVSFNICYFYFTYCFIGMTLSFGSICLIFSVANLSNLIPIHGPARLGSYEAVNSIVLLALNFSANEAIQISFAVHFVGILVQALIAIPCYLSMRLSVKGMRRGDVPG